MTRFARYLSVQLAAYAIDMSGFWLLCSFLMISPVQANLVSKLTSGIFAFFAQRVFTFRLNGSAGTLRQAAIYFFFVGVNLPLSSGILHLLLQIINWPLAAKFCSDLICVLLNYWVSRRFIFQ